MAWEMGRHMHGHVAPSIWLHACRRAKKREPTLAFLGEQLAAIEFAADDDCDDSDYDLYTQVAVDIVRENGKTWAVNLIAQATVEMGMTVNGGYEFYLPDRWETVPWCTDEQLEAWHG